MAEGIALGKPLSRFFKSLAIWNLLAARASSLLAEGDRGVTFAEERVAPRGVYFSELWKAPWNHWKPQHRGGHACAISSPIGTLTGRSPLFIWRGCFRNYRARRGLEDLGCWHNGGNTEGNFIGRKKFYELIGFRSLPHPASARSAVGS